jgi:hypothetical protein
MSSNSESVFRALIKAMVGRGKYPDHVSVRNALGRRNAGPALRSGLTLEETKWRIEEVERAGFDWKSSKTAKTLIPKSPGARTRV